MTYLWTHIHFCYPKPFHSCFCRFVPKHMLPSEPKIFFSSVTGEQEELVAKMLASGMDEATAYQYLQQLCGGAGKGMTPEAKALMEQILASNGSKEEIASRVKALLDGSELSSSRGMNGGFDGTNLSEARSRRGGLPMDPMARPGQQGGSLADRIRAS